MSQGLEQIAIDHVAVDKHSTAIDKDQIVAHKDYIVVGKDQIIVVKDSIVMEKHHLIMNIPKCHKKILIFNQTLNLKWS